MNAPAPHTPPPAERRCWNCKTPLTGPRARLGCSCDDCATETHVLRPGT